MELLMFQSFKDITNAISIGANWKTIKYINKGRTNNQPVMFSLDCFVAKNFLFFATAAVFAFAVIHIPPMGMLWEKIVDFAPIQNSQYQASYNPNAALAVSAASSRFF